MVKVIFTIPEEYKRKLRLYADTYHGGNRSLLIRHALKEYIAKLNAMQLKLPIKQRRPGD